MVPMAEARAVAESSSRRANRGAFFRTSGSTRCLLDQPLGGRQKATLQPLRKAGVASARLGRVKPMPGSRSSNAASAPPAPIEAAVPTPFDKSRTALVRRARTINRVLAETYPDAHTELDFRRSEEH